MNELSKLGDVQYTEFFLPESMPKFCIGCQLCMGGPQEKCPHSQYVAPILDALISSDALIFTTPHYAACSMSSCMKNLLDHLDFLTLNVAPRKELFDKKAFILTTGAGSTAAIKPIKKFLKNWGTNRVYSLGFRMFTDKWDKLSKSKQMKSEKAICHAARKFYYSKKRLPYISTVFMYYMSKFIIRKYVGEDAYPYKYWAANGFFDKRPF